MHLARLNHLLEELARAHLLRQPDDELQREILRQRHGEAFLDLSHNDYLGLRTGQRAGPRKGERAEPSARDEGGSEDVSRETEPPRPQAELAPGAPEWLESSSELTPRGPSSEPRRPSGIVFRGDDDVPAALLDGVSRETAPWGAGSSRLLYGTDPAHLDVEAEVAAWLDQPAALLFPSGYAANVGALSALLDREDCVVSDTMNHASLIDGIRLSRAQAVVTPHLDLQAVERALEHGQAAPARWVVVESYYSMDGDGPDLQALRALCDRFDAHLYVDEAHGLGLFGPRGAGRLVESGVQADVVLAGFGKAVGAQGACVASSAAVRIWLWNRARSFVFSTAVSPQLAEGLFEQIQRTQAADAERTHVAELAQRVRHGLAEQGWALAPGSFGPIVSLVLGEPKRVLDLARRLAGLGVLAQAIRPPTVPEGASRLRLTLHAGLRTDDAERLLQVLAAEAPRVGAQP